jgi:putative ABC transport system permease protein
VSAGLARRFWPAGQASGQRIKVGPADSEEWLRVVGVVGDVRNRMLQDSPDLATYEPHTQRPWNGMFVMVRTAGPPAPLVDSIRRTLRELEPQAVLSSISTMDERVAQSVASRRFHAIVVGAFAGATLVLVALALYGVLAASVAARTREIGIRAAVGATSSALTRQILFEGLQPALIGVSFGLIGGALAAWTMRALLFEISPRDPSTYAGTLAIMVGISIASCWFPARRAARVDPSVALRAE